MKMKGYTLLELLVTFSIVAILAVSLTGSFKAGYQHVMLKFYVNQIINEINLARSIAINRSQQITYSLGSIQGVSKRYILCGQKILHSFKELPQQYHLVLKNSLSRNDSIIFTPLGFTYEQRASFYLSSSEEMARIVVGLSTCSGYFITDAKNSSS